MLYVKSMEIKLTLHTNETARKMFARDVTLYDHEDFLEWNNALYLRFSPPYEFTEIGWIRGCETGRFVQLQDGLLFQPVWEHTWIVQKTSKQ